LSTPEGVPGAPSNPSNPFGDAAAATRSMIDSANAEPANTAEFTPQTDTPVDAPAPGTTPDPAQDTGTPLSWESIDLSVLPEDARKVVQEGYLRHSDYTRKTQELAEQRKQFESLGDIEAVQAAVEFARSLEDPSNLMQLKAEIEEHLTTLGATPAAAQAASAQLTDTPDTPGLDPAISRDLADLKAWKAEQVHAREEAELVSQMQNMLQTAEDAIRKDYPTYSQKDIDKIYERLGNPEIGYDLFKAQEQYESDRQYFTESLIGNKGNHPDVANNVRTDTLVMQPHEMNTMEDAKKATAALFSQG
jgi:hypothetical protein